MLIKNLQINGFGKLEDINVNLKKGINIVVGKNESGKSTFSEFIKGIFYGVSRNKNGKDYSDYERFKPWNDANFSGKLVYAMNNEEYVVYRDFNRNNTKVYDKSGVEITSEFNKDKARGAEVGIEHFGMDEDTFENSVFVKQNGIKINEASQSSILQKLSNIIQSGEEEVSYQATIKKLEKILLEEVGTDRTQNKPKNILNRELTELNSRKSILISNKEKHENIEQSLREVQERIKNTNDKLDKAIKVFNIKNKYEKMIQEQKAEFDISVKIKKEQRIKAKKETDKKKIIDTLLILISTIVLTIAFIYTKEIILAVLAMLIGIASVILNLKFSYKEEIEIESDNFDVVSEESRKKETKELSILESEGVKKNLTEKKIAELKTIIENLEKEKNNNMLEEHKLKIEDNALKESLSSLSEIEEELIFKKENLQQVLEKEDVLNFAITKLKESYEELKDDVIPDFEKDIKYAISKTTNSKYTKIKYNDYDGLIVENDFGQYIPIDKLSLGTIDQMYLGFRLAIADKYNNIPIVFDEAFVFCDEDRLKNILKTLSEMAEERQIIILSCSEREKTILEELKVEFNCIKL